MLKCAIKNSLTYEHTSRMKTHLVTGNVSAGQWE